jgi:NADH dehydrogenase
MSPAPSARPHLAHNKGGRATVVVVGGGFGGLAVVRALRRLPVRTVLVDQNNYHQFTPLLYQVATSLLDPPEIAQPLRAIIRKVRNAEFFLGAVDSIDLERRTVHTSDGALAYDYLVLAAGSTTNFFGNASAEALGFGLKTVDDALNLRNRILMQYEAAKWADDDAARDRLMTFAVIGGGPTGVECSGALAEIDRVLAKDFREMATAGARVHLLEGSDRLLAPFAPHLRAAANRRLTRMGVTIHLNAHVTEVRPDGVALADGSFISAATVIWAAGVQAAPISATLGAKLGRQNAVEVEQTLQLAGHPEVFVIGDMAAFTAEGSQLPMLAPVAMQQGAVAAANIGQLLSGQTLARFHFVDKGIMATVGRNSAVVQAGRLKVHGFAGWLAWLGIHLLLIVSLESKLQTIASWAYNYLFFDRPLRLIIRPSDRRPTVSAPLVIKRVIVAKPRSPRRKSGV